LYGIFCDTQYPARDSISPGLTWLVLVEAVTFTWVCVTVPCGSLRVLWIVLEVSADAAGAVAKPIVSKLVAAVRTVAMRVMAVTSGLLIRSFPNLIGTDDWPESLK
jgi:hypothetical protein